MLKAELECFPTGSQKEAAVAVDHLLLSVARCQALVAVLRRELQSCPEVSEEMNMAALVDERQIPHLLAESRKSIGDSSVDEQTVSFQLFNERAIDHSGFLAHRQLMREESSIHIKDQVIARSLATNGERLGVNDDEAGTPATVDEYDIAKTA